MRPRLVTLLCVLALLLPASALAAKAARTDGTLSLRNANVTKVVIQANGAVVGRFDVGRLVLTDHVLDDGSEPVLIGCKSERSLSEKTTICVGGRNIRFRSIGGKFTLRITNATDVDLSAVGRGKVILEGKGLLNDGKYSFDGQPYQNVPFTEASFFLGDPPPAAGLNP